MANRPPTYRDSEEAPMVALKKPNPKKYKSRLIFPGVKKISAEDVKKRVDNLKAADQKETAKERERA